MIAIDDDNYTFYACKSYTGHNINKKEFDNDLKKISQISRHLTRYNNGHEVNLRVLINLVITFYNVFDLEVGTRLILFKLPEKLHNRFCTILKFLDILPVDIQMAFEYEIDKPFLMELHHSLNCR